MCKRHNCERSERQGILYSPRTLTRLAGEPNWPHRHRATRCVCASHQPTKPPAGHRVEFGEGVDDDGLVGEL
eukprot:scaffold213643_cov31-Tisochrysis_lutea.AAC.5